VRELENEIERLVTFAEDGQILQPEHLSAKFFARAKPQPRGQTLLYKIARRHRGVGTANARRGRGKISGNKAKWRGCSASAASACNARWSASVFPEKQKRYDSARQISLDGLLEIVLTISIVGVIIYHESRKEIESLALDLLQARTDFAYALCERYDELEASPHTGAERRNSPRAHCYRRYISVLQNEPADKKGELVIHRSTKAEI